MNWNRFFSFIICGFIGLTACKSPHEEEQQADRPNIIFILADDLGWADVGYQGAEYYETPNIDQLAHAGIQFTNAYANAANCAPTRASIMSGQYTPRHGILTVGASHRGDRKAQRLIPVPNKSILDTATVSLAEMLKTAGYHTAFIGKWHLGNHLETSPLAHGFDYTLAGWERGSPKSYFSPYQNPALEDGPEGEHLTDRLTDEAMAYMQRQRETENPFFLYLSYYAVHAPFEAKDSLVAKYRQKTPVVEGRDNPVYAGMVKTLDDNIGRLHQYLEQTGLLENTFLVFWSDNGGSFRATVNDPLKGAKGMPYEGGIRVPAFVYAPNFFPEARTVETPVISTDLYPTFAKWAGATLNENYPLDGISLLPFIEGGQTRERSLFWYAPVYLPGSDGYAFRMCPSSVIRQGSHKLIWWYGTNQTEMYNVANDPGETRDLLQHEDSLARGLMAQLRAWHTEINAAIPDQKNPLFDSAYVESTYESVCYP